MPANFNRAPSFRQQARKIGLTASASIIFAGLGCVKAPTLHETILSHLRDKGPIEVVPDNPFLASSLLLAKEAESSPEMRGFLEHKGSPKAFEVQGAESGRSSITFYYPDSREKYTFDKADGVYIISGPFPLDPKKIGELQTLGAPGAAKAQAPLPARTQEPKQSAAPAKKPDPTGAPSQMPTQPPKEIKTSAQANEPADKKVEAAPAAAPIDTPKAPPTRTEPTPDQAPTIQEIIGKYGGANPAETTSKGDLVHFVTFQGESLSIISRWYTLDLANAPRIARINRLKDPNDLKLGDQIIIPSYLVKNKSRLTAPGMQALIEGVLPPSAGAGKAD